MMHDSGPAGAQSSDQEAGGQSGNAGDDAMHTPISDQVGDRELGSTETLGEEHRDSTNDTQVDPAATPDSRS